MRLLLTTDLHMTPRPEHAYRFEYLSWVHELARDEDVEGIVILGDLTDAKDHHPGSLVNEISDRLNHLASDFQVHVLRGNHDGPSPDRPFWNFLRHTYVSYYTGFFFNRDGLVFVPFGTEGEFLEWLPSAPNRTHCVFMHATVNGARVENGTLLESALPSRFLPDGFKGMVFSGDIHVPQKCGDVLYVGTPYHVHFGDTFEPRTLIIDSETPHELQNFQWEGAPRLITLRPDIDGRVLDDARPHDRIKVIAQATREVLPQEWQQYVKDARAHFGGQLVSVSLERRPYNNQQRAPSARRSDEAIVRTYAQSQRYPEAIIEAGLQIISGAESPTP